MRSFAVRRLLRLAIPGLVLVVSLSALTQSNRAALYEATPATDPLMLLAAGDPAPAVTRPVLPVQTTVEVNATQQIVPNGLPVPYHITSNEVLASAGTWGDFSRYLQTMPGTVANSDTSNDLIVRGGNPAENLFVVDGIEVPNINHIAIEGTTGGFTSMIDTATIASVEMKPGDYDARYSTRLSSLIEIQTLDRPHKPLSGEADLGISGAGGFLQRTLGRNSSLLTAAHRSVLNLFTDDIGINGVPIYTDGMAQWQWSPTSRDRVSALSLNGADSIDIHPQACDNGETSRVQTQYGGSRSTDGAVWRHIHSPSMVSNLTASYSAQNQNIAQQWQITNSSNTQSCFQAPVVSEPVYSEQTHDGFATVNYSIQVENRGWLYSAGATAKLTAFDYRVSQPKGEQSPFNTSSTWTDADNFTRRFRTGQTGLYAEATGNLGTRWTLNVGAREETFALTGTHAFNPRVSLGFRAGSHQTLNAAFSRSSQLAPTMDLLSYSANSRLRPLKAEQFSAGADLWRGAWATVSLAAYRKNYLNEPVSTEYSSLMLANMVDTLGQQFIWLPLKNGGHGRSQGLELLLRAHAAQRVRFQGSVSYSRTRYAAADGVLRPGNFDLPLVGNGLMSFVLPYGFEITVRNTYATGRPYTPFNISLSEAQSRGIYDLTQVNAVRGSAYNRVDADFHRTFRIHGKPLTIYGGAENVLDRKNFLGMEWEDNCHPSANEQVCGENQNAVVGVPESEVTQMPRFPSGGIRYSF